MKPIIKLILLLLFFVSYVQAVVLQNSVDISKDFHSVNSPEYIYYIKDKNNTLDPETVLHSRALTQAKTVSIGKAKAPVWTKITLNNTSDTIQHLSLFNQQADTKVIDVFVFKNDKLVKSHTLGSKREQSKREVLTRYSMFNLTLLAGESATVVSKIKNFLIYNISWEIQKSEVFMEKENFFIFGLAFYGGLSTFFAVLTFLLYKIYKQKEYLVLSLYFLTAMVYEYSYHGVLYQLDMGLNLKLINLLPWSTALVSFILIALFANFLFNFKESYPKLAFFTKLLVSLLSIEFILVLYSQLTNEYINFIFSFYLYLSLFTVLSFIAIGIYMFLKDEPSSRYYLLGHVTFLLAVFVNILGVYNVITYYESFKLLLPAAIMLDSVFLFVAQYIKTKKIQLELYKNKELLLEQSRFISVGQAIGNITHQWKRPLSNLGSSMTYIEAVLKNDSQNLAKALDTKLPNIVKNIQQMQYTIDDFSNYYSTINKVNTFHPKAVLKKYVFELLNSKITLKNVEIKLNIDDELKLSCYEHVFSNIMMILIDNSLDSFQSKNAHNTIKISITKKQNKYQINYSDNAGGIKIEPIEKVFEYFVSSKKTDDLKGYGIGLTIAKMLIEDRLNGKISVKNIDNGVSFKIFF